MFLFTRKKSLFSRLVGWYLDEPTNHFVIYLDALEVVVHSNFKGVHVEDAERFKKENTVNFMLAPKKQLSKDQQEKFLFETVFKSYFNRPYDFGAFIFWPVKDFFEYIFKINYKHNLWSSKEGLLCTEFAASIKNLSIKIDWPDNLEITTAYQLYLQMKKSPDLIEVTEI